MFAFDINHVDNRHIENDNNEQENSSNEEISLESYFNALKLANSILPEDIKNPSASSSFSMNIKPFQAFHRRYSSQRTRDFLSWSGGTALIYAASAGHVEIVKLLLKHGASVNLPGCNNESALLVASSNGHQQVVETLLAYHGDPNYSDNSGYTPLIEASARGHSKVVELLLAYQADISSHLIDNNYCPLLAACENGSSEILQMLLNHGAISSLQHKELAIYYATFYQHQELLPLINEHEQSYDCYSKNTTTNV